MKQTITTLLCIFSISLHAQGLPEAWQGKWAGTCDIWAFNKITRSFPMSLDISPTDSGYTFIINYQIDSTKPDIRRYSLILVEDSIGHYAIDEHNSIILDTYLNGNCMFTNFGVVTTDLQTRICLENGEMEYEITSVNADPIRRSGNEVIGKDSIPEVKSYKLFHFMKARLRK